MNSDTTGDTQTQGNANSGRQSFMGVCGGQPRAGVM